MAKETISLTKIILGVSIVISLGTVLGVAGYLAMKPKINNCRFEKVSE